MKKLIKARKAKRSDRGIYLQDKELLDTAFKAGSHFKYIIDTKDKKVIILPSTDQKDNTVSGRKMNENIKPVIDIRKKEALSLFKDAPYLQVEIYGDQIIIEAFDTQDSNATDKQKENKSRYRNKVKDIRQILKVKKLATLKCSQKELQKAVGHVDVTQQLDIFDFLPSENSSTSNIAYIKKALKNLHIPLQVVSLFSGAGLFDHGFIDSGFEVIFALEKDEEIAKTYRYNIGDITTADIREFDKTKLPFAPVVIGGSPCKGFSLSNGYSRFLDNPNNLLVSEYIKCVQQINPYVFVLENVPQILTAGNGQFLKEIQNELSGYQIIKGVISSATYGDPQDRKRAFIIGSRLGEEIALPKPKLLPVHFKTVSEAFKGLLPSTPNQQDISKPKPITLERMSHVRPGGNVFDIPEEIRPKGKHSDMYKRLSWDQPAVTIVNPRKAQLLHPSENRIISIREACRLFSLPDTYIFKGGLSAMQESIANGIPVKMVKAIANQVKNAIERFNIRNHQNKTVLL